MALPIDPSMVSTTEQLPGFTVVRSLGVVEGITTSVMLGGFFERSILISAMREAFLDMLVQAAEHGAEGVIGMRYEVMIESQLVMAYGTAVQLRRL